MNAYYTQSANQIFPIFGVNSIEEAKEFSGEKEVIETKQPRGNKMRLAIAYGPIGKIASRILVKLIFKKCRPHWIRDCFSGFKRFSDLPR